MFVTLIKTLQPCDRARSPRRPTPPRSGERLLSKQTLMVLLLGAAGARAAQEASPCGFCQGTGFTEYHHELDGIYYPVETVVQIRKAFNGDIQWIDYHDGSDGKKSFDDQPLHLKEKDIRKGIKEYRKAWGFWSPPDKTCQRTKIITRFQFRLRTILKIDGGIKEVKKTACPKCRADTYKINDCVSCSICDEYKDSQKYRCRDCTGVFCAQHCSKTLHRTRCCTDPHQDPLRISNSDLSGGHFKKCTKHDSDEYASLKCSSEDENWISLTCRCEGNPGSGTCNLCGDDERGPVGHVNFCKLCVPCKECHPDEHTWWENVWQKCILQPGEVAIGMSPTTIDKIIARRRRLGTMKRLATLEAKNSK